MRWSAQTPSTTTIPCGLHRPVLPGRCAGQSHDAYARLVAGEQRLEDLGPQPRQVELLAVPELVRPDDLRLRQARAASVDLPAPPRPPIPTNVKLRGGRAAAISSSTAGRPRPHASRARDGTERPLASGTMV